MHADALEQRPTKERAAIALAVILSLMAHGVLGGTMSRVEPRKRAEPVWAEMVVIETPPPVEVVPEPEPEPEPEPPPKPPRDEVVKFEDTTDEPPPPNAPPPEREPVRQLVQGLSNSSFVEGAPTGLQVRAGNTTSTKAGAIKPPEDDVGPFTQVAYEQVSTAPKITRRPLLTVPDTLKEAKVQGTVIVELTIGSDGRVIEAAVVRALHPDADAACVRDLKTLSRWAPGTRDGSPVTVTGVPFKCTYEERE